MYPKGFYIELHHVIMRLDLRFYSILRYIAIGFATSEYIAIGFAITTLLEKQAMIKKLSSSEVSNPHDTNPFSAMPYISWLTQN
ncbi:hypothetical protein KIN20_011744 [Parelaphostrongylus tenuis]|uniref:Uncharacterized protein n=1 Tax=Parelaphostrongylus tenuis TaxID=148309 RepID=A0AAD5N0I6_PARTN|nr:hypothetical protein KIN20_011744 [Parelaphostrongylus tenuis]